MSKNFKNHYQNRIAELKAEVERLTEFTTRTIIPNEVLQAEVERLKKYNEEAMAHIAKEERKSRERLDMAQAEIERLKNNCNYLDTIPNEELQAQVERLTKAGDELGEWFMDIHPSKKKWNAAKEGKQS
jgi:uncharacterized small protein (DUF1192 family)